MAWIVLEEIAATKHKLALLRDSTLSCLWETRMYPNSKIAARLVRVLALRQCLYQAASMFMLDVAGEDNDIANIPSRSFRLGHR